MTGIPQNFDDIPPPVCSCKATQVVRRKFSNGVCHFVAQCQVCGRQVGGAISVPNVRALIRDESLAPPWDESIIARWDEKQAQWRDQRQARKEAILNASIANYHEYLESPEWAQKRRAVLRRAEGICEGCGEARATQVHHLTYDHIGDELLFELVAVCEDCHEKAHNKVGRPWQQ